MNTCGLKAFPLTRALRGLGCGLVLCTYGAAPVLADDTEIFSGNLRSANPNVLLVIDTSGSMDEPADNERAPFDRTAVYTGNCRSDSIYWRMDEGTEPDCLNEGPDNYFEPEALVCDTAVQAIQSAGFGLTDGVAQWNPATQRWVPLAPAVKNQPIECEADAGLHGPDSGDTRRWPADVTQWTNVQADRFDFSANFTNRPFIFYDGNYLNWLRQPPAPPASRPSRMDVVKGAASTLVQTVNNVNLGLMRYSANADGGAGELAAEGGMVIYPVTSLGQTSRQELVDRINALDPAGFTPMSETLYEARQYFAGDSVLFGRESRLWPGSQGGFDGRFPSVAASRSVDGNQYISPATAQCQQNFIIYLTDGLPTRDNSADDEIAALLGVVDPGADVTGRHAVDDTAEGARPSASRAGVGGEVEVVTP
ncbi:MAG: hypothetical protein HC872_06760 [Gammaproteobacteria bacterium]|nr:hypothetical protein [Gammaproteobacteria bacterium]